MHWDGRYYAPLMQILGRPVAACVTRGLDHAGRIYPTCASKCSKSGKPDFGWSIVFRKKFFRTMMDCRVKPGNDGFWAQNAPAGAWFTPGREALRPVA